MKHRVWPANDYFDNNKKDHVSFGVGMRFLCWRRVDFSIQCKNELTVNIKFKRHHWAHRWYNRSEFNRQFPQLSIFNSNPEVINLVDVNLFANPVQGCNVDEYDINNDVGGNETNTSNEFTVQNTVIESENTVVSYKDVLGVATELCRIVSEEQT